MFILKVVNMVFAVLFTIEMLLKWMAFGLYTYFTSMWTCLDFVIVCVSICARTANCFHCEHRSLGVCKLLFLLLFWRHFIKRFYI